MSIDLTFRGIHSVTKGFEITQELVNRFAEVSGDTNPVHLDPESESAQKFGGTIAHGVLLESFVSAILGTSFPGNGAIFMGKKTQFKAAVPANSKVEIDVTMAGRDKNNPRVATFDVEIWLLNEEKLRDKVVVVGIATCLLPKE